MTNQNDPLKVPFVKVFNFADKLVLSSSFHAVGNESPGVDLVSFKYEYDDDDDDKCTIRLQANDPSWIDYLGMAVNDIITVSWGYINGPNVSNRKVVIRDFKSKYGPNEIYTELVCTDMATYLKLTNSPYTNRIAPIDYIRDYCEGILNIYITSAGRNIYTQMASEKEGYKEEVYISAVKKPEDIQVPNKASENPYLENKLIYSSEDTPIGKWGVGSENEVRKFLEKERDMNVANKSPYTVLYELMQLAPQGPWYITGRDGALYIHNRNLGDNVYKSYRYKQEPGDLIDFTPETKYENFSKSTISQVGMDPFNKSTSVIDSYISILDKLRSSKDIITDKGISDKQKEKELEEWLMVYNSSYQKFKTYRLGMRVTAGDMVFPTDKFEDKYREEPGVARRDATKVTNPLVKSGKRNPTNYIDPLDTILFGYQYVTPISDGDDNTNMVENSARKLRMEKEEADATFEGDPNIKNDQKVSISNVQAQHVGDYYIKKCTHEISFMGYKVETEMLKVTDDAVIHLYKSDKTYGSETSIVEGKTPKPGSGKVLNIPERFKNMTVAEADALLAEDLKLYEGIVNNKLTVQVTQNQFDALVDHTYNTGGSDDLFALINSKAPDAVIKAQFIEHYITSDGAILPGLVKRRNREYELFITPGAIALEPKAMVNVAFLKSFEGLHDGDSKTPYLQPALCSAGYWTVGWGHRLTTTDGVDVVPEEKQTSETLKVKGEEKYKKESNIFRKWNIQPMISTTTIPSTGSLSANIPITQGYSINNYVSLDEYIKQRPDTKAKDIINLYNAGKLKFEEVNIENR